jgi:hypothetical protein
MYCPFPDLPTQVTRCVWVRYSVFQTSLQELAISKWSVSFCCKIYRLNDNDCVASRTRHDLVEMHCNIAEETYCLSEDLASHTRYDLVEGQITSSVTLRESLCSYEAVMQPNNDYVLQNNNI